MDSESSEVVFPGMPFSPDDSEPYDSIENGGFAVALDIANERLIGDVDASDKLGYICQSCVMDTCPEVCDNCMSNSKCSSE